MLAFIACSSFGILCHHSYHDAGVKEAVISETTEGVVNEMSEMTDDDLESEVSGCECLSEDSFKTCLCTTKSVSYTSVF